MFAIIGLQFTCNSKMIVKVCVPKGSKIRSVSFSKPLHLGPGMFDTAKKVFTVEANDLISTPEELNLDDKYDNDRMDDIQTEAYKIPSHLYSGLLPDYYNELVVYASWDRNRFVYSLIITMTIEDTNV